MILRTISHDLQKLQTRVFLQLEPKQPFFAIVSAIINPDECSIPAEHSSGRQGDTMLAQVGRVLARIEIGTHAFNFFLSSSLQVSLE
jgi:hypothetical protein